MPVYYGNQINKASWRAAIRYINPPDLVISFDAHIPQKVRVGSGGKITLTQVRTGIEGLNAHFQHIPANLAFTDPVASLFKFFSYTSIPMRVLCVIDWIDVMFVEKLFVRNDECLGHV